MQCEVNKGPVHVNEFFRYHGREKSPLFSIFSNRSSSSFARSIITARVSLWFVTQYRQQCVVLEIIHTTPTDGHWKFLEGGGI